METSGQATTGPQAPTTDGSLEPLLTVTLTVAEVAVLPEVSVATAASVWLPATAVVVSQVTEYGLVVSAAPRLAPSRVNWTAARPTLSLALAATEMVPETVVPSGGV